MKQRFSYLDLRLITNEVSQELKDCYLQNIYSLENSSRHFLLKFDARSGETGKRFIIVDPGMRYHLTQYQHEPTQQPSHFVQKLRKYLKNKRATGFWVAPGSRLIVITFNGGQFFLVFEFFSGGNIIVLDASYQIMTLHRVVRDVGPSHQNYQIGEFYGLEMINEENSQESLGLQQMPSREQLKEWVSHDKLGKALYAKVSDPSSSLLEFCLRDQGLDPKKKLDLNGDESEKFLDKVYAAVHQALAVSHQLIASQEPVKGYTLLDDQENSLEFEPFREYFDLVHPESTVKEYPSYNEAVDKYFGALLSDKRVNKEEQLYALAESRLDAARNEKNHRISSLEQQQKLNEEIGNAIQEHAHTVDAAISAVKALVLQGVDWVDTENLIKLEQQKGNTIAQTIQSLDLRNQKINLKLDDHSVAVHLDKSAYANARDYFEVKKAAAAKIEKTEQHASKALKSAELKIKRDLEANLAKHRQAGAQSQLHALRKTYWFEKFWWFLTSTNHLVIAAREEMQQDLLLRRYFHNGDIALSSDAPEATLAIVKNHSCSTIPPQVLLQAASFVVASSTKTWESKSKAPSWYLSRQQVPKVNSKGEPISMRDLFQIKDRVVIPPTSIDMGFAILWQSKHSEDKEVVTQDVVCVNQDSSEEDFPDTEINSDDDFPDTNIDYDSDLEEVSEDENSGSISSVAAVNEASTQLPRNTKGSVEEQQKIVAGDVEQSDQYIKEQDENQKGEKERGVKIQDENEQSEKMEDKEIDKEQLKNSRTSSLTSQSSLRQGSLEPMSNVPKKVRGGKKKLKKYLEQDDEDRKAAMERLGTLKGLERKMAEKESKEQARKAFQEQQEQRKQRKRQVELAIINSEDAHTENQPIPSDLLYSFTESESIIAAVPMFAPWSVIQKAQYKVKLVYGPLKKGKASSELLRIVLNTHSSAASEREQQLVAAIRPADVQQLIAVSRVQILTNNADKGNSKFKSKKSGSTKSSGKKLGKNKK